MLSFSLDLLAQLLNNRVGDFPRRGLANKTPKKCQKATLELRLKATFKRKCKGKFVGRRKRRQVVPQPIAQAESGLPVLAQEKV